MSNTGGPAFPHTDFEAGMTLRDYFAAKAMQAALASCSLQDGEGDDLTDSCCKLAYKVADVMLIARENNCE